MRKLEIQVAFWRGARVPPAYKPLYAMFTVGYAKAAFGMRTGCHGHSVVHDASSPYGHVTRKDVIFDHTRATFITRVIATAAVGIRGGRGKQTKSMISSMQQYGVRHRRYFHHA